MNHPADEPLAHYLMDKKLAHYWMDKNGKIHPGKRPPRGLSQHLPSTWEQYRAADHRITESWYRPIPGSFADRIERIGLTLVASLWIGFNPKPDYPRISKINHLWKDQDMQQEFTDEQILDALTKTARLMGDIDISGDGDDATVIGPAYWDRDELEAVRTILAVLPDPDNEWEECELEDIKPGDYVKIIDDTNSFTAELTYKKPVIKVRPNMNGKIHHIEFGGEVGHRTFTPTTQFFRSPAKHPDPEIHEFIRDENDGETLMAATNGFYVDKNRHMWPAHDFTNWTPMKVVEDDR